MPSATPPRDVSVGWPTHAVCGMRHDPVAECPPRGRWLAAWGEGRKYRPGQKKGRK